MIRSATIADAEAIARVDLDAHIEAYRPIFGDEDMASVSMEETAEHWRILLGKQSPIEHEPDEVLVAERDGTIVAYSGIGPSGDADGSGCGEVFTLYVHPSAWRSRVGARLLGAAVGRLRQRGFADITLWVLDANERAQAFYQAQGWTPDGGTRPSRHAPHHHFRYRAPAPP